MPYESVDQLQRVLAQDVFHYAKDAKKAAGRALGTLVEIITFYLLKTWEFESATAIERPLAKYGNPAITHNVEYSLHPALRQYGLVMSAKILPVTSARIFAKLDESIFPSSDYQRFARVLLTKDGIVRNACLIAKGPQTQIMAYLNHKTADEIRVTLVEQHHKPYSMFECKRVGVEEGMKKGPQTIEKAKQGAYVAKAVSSLQKVRQASGELHGLIAQSDQSFYARPYSELLSEIMLSDQSSLLRDFILTVGVVSNHGNWFSSTQQNKEIKVLAQAYDWLLFLTDEGLAEFITELLLTPQPLLQAARTAFLASYTGLRNTNRFTKVQIDYDADQALQAFFSRNLTQIESWFNVITPATQSMSGLKNQLRQLRAKDWHTIHNL